MFLVGAALAGATRAARAARGGIGWGGVRVGAVSAGDPAGQQAVHAAGVEVGEQDGDRLADDPAAVGGGAVAQQREPGAFQVK